MEHFQIEIEAFTPKGLEKIADRHAPGIARRGGAARHGHGLDPGFPGEGGGPAEEHLAAPDGAVAAVARPVEDDADAGALKPVFRQH